MKGFKMKRTNILFAIADDASHMSAYGHIIWMERGRSRDINKIVNGKL